MKYFVTLRLHVEDASPKLTEYAVGLPSPIVYLSFIENLLIKSNLKKPGQDTHQPVNLVYGFKSFEILENHVSRSSQRLGYQSIKDDPKVKPRAGYLNSSMIDTYKANIETSLRFEVNTLHSTEELKKLFNRVILKLRFAKGFIKRYSVSVFEGNEKGYKSASYKMFPAMIACHENREIKDTQELVKRLVITNKKEGDKKDDLDRGNYALTVIGYRLLEKSREESVGYDNYFSETLVGLISFKALTMSNYQSVSKWNFANNKDHLIAKGA